MIGRVATSTPANWVRSGWGKHVDSIDQLMLAVSRLGMNEIGRRFVWRGTSNYAWSIDSSIQRFMRERPGLGDPQAESDVRLLERRVLAHARRWRLDVGDSQDHELLSYLQHHGSPTRLLDVTTDPMVALWFASGRTTGERDVPGVFFAFDVSDFPVVETATSRLRVTYGSLSDRSWHLAQNLEDSEENASPFLVSPSNPDARMGAQRGLFVAGSVPTQPAIAGLNAFTLSPGTQPPDGTLDRLIGYAQRPDGRPVRIPFAALIIPPSLKAPLRTQLATTYDITESNLFPDYAGIAANLHGDPTLPQVGPEDADIDRHPA
jgi:hypothetical protein